MYWVVWKQQQQSNKKQQQKQKFLLILYHLSILGWFNRAMLHSQYHRARFITFSLILAAALCPCVTRPSAVMLWTQFSRHIPVSAPGKLILQWPHVSHSYENYLLDGLLDTHIPHVTPVFITIGCFDRLGFVQFVMFCCGILISYDFSYIVLK